MNEKLGEILMRKGLIGELQLQKALEEQKMTHEKLGQVLVNLGMVSVSELGKALAEQANIEYVNLESEPLSAELFGLLQEEFIRTNQIMPVRRTNGTLFVACVPPIDPETLEKARLMTGMKVTPFVTTEFEFEQALNKIYNLKKQADNLIASIGAIRAESNQVIPIITDTSKDSSIAGLVNSILSDAIRRSASDVHFDPSQRGVKIKYRIDGLMSDNITLPREVADSVVTRIKVTAGMDIAERRRPQGGHFSVQYKKEFYDFRVSSMGTTFGEKLTIRILSKQKILMPSERLGMLPEQLLRFNELLEMPYGIILVAGPTGSGKTTTLYSALSKLNSGNKTIVTLEDPIEYNIEGVNQIQINEEAGINFPSGLRSVLRLDPDIIMIGEIRDLETARVAVEASLTGHLVLASIHTNDAASVPVRLLNLGLESYLISSSLVGVIAQRLVRKICTNCKTQYRMAGEDRQFIASFVNPEETEYLNRGKGCHICDFTGYKGRTGIYEIMQMNKRTRLLIQNSASYYELRDAFVESGGYTMLKSGLIKTVEGITTIEEVKKAVMEL